MGRKKSIFGEPGNSSEEEQEKGEQQETVLSQPETTDGTDILEAEKEFVKFKIAVPVKIEEPDI